MPTKEESSLELRQRAEDIVSVDKAASQPHSPEETDPLIYEMRVHQIELEMQNEELLRTHHDLATAKARYFDLYDLAPVGYLTLSSIGIIQEANLTAANLLGVTRKDLQSKLITNFIMPEDQQVYYLHRKRHAEVQFYGTDQAFSAQGFEIRLQRPDKSFFWAHLQDALADNDEYRITLTDITGLKQAEDNLRGSDERFRAIFERSTVGKSLTAPEGKLLQVNQALADMLGYSIEEMQQLDFAQVTHPDDVAASREYIRSLMAGEQAAYRFEKRYIHKNDTIVWADVSSTLLYDEQGAPLHLITSIVDITERKRSEEARLLLEQQFQQTQKLESLGILAGGIAHDFNNILTVIICNCSLLLQRPHMVAELVPEIDTAAQRAADLCRQMLIYAGKAQPIPTRVNVKTLVEEMVKMLRATINQNVTITLDISADIPSIKADASQIRQVVMNLIINASEAIGTEQGIITVSLAITAIGAGQSARDHLGKVITPGSYLCLNVTDNGCGMDEGTKLRIFEPFYTTKFTGRGLGMSVVLGIITAHHGALQLTSQLDFGTTFKVYLPVQSSEQALDLLPRVTVKQWQGSGTVLLVEDEPQLIMVAKELIQELGFTVIEAVNGQAALDMYQKNAEYITLVLTDIGMPVMDGYELISELKILNPELPIIVSSGFGDAEVTSHIHGNIAGCISKPYSFDQLLEVLKGVVERAK